MQDVAKIVFVLFTCTLVDVVGEHDVAVGEARGYADHSLVPRIMGHD